MAIASLYQGTTLVVPNGVSAHRGALASAWPIDNRTQVDNLPNKPLRSL
jgi:hypothetical protein